MDNSILEHKKQKINAERSAPLSTSHIRPRITYYKGSSYIKTSKGGTNERTGGGKRQGIKGFSSGSRRRMLQMIGKIRRDAQLPKFVTLTYPEYFPDVAEAKRDLKVFLQRLNRKYPEAGIIWKLEPQQRGAPHYHMLVWVNENEGKLLGWVVKNWHEIAGRGDLNHFKFHMGWLHDTQPCVAQVRSFKGVWAYASKYIGKTFEVAEWGSQWVGRFWGTVNKDHIPFGDEIELDLSVRDVNHIQRLQRRFMGLKKASRNGLSTFCDADQWVTRAIPWAKSQPGKDNSVSAPRKGLPKRGGTAPQSGGVPSFGEGAGANGIVEPKYFKSGTLNGRLDWMRFNESVQQLDLLDAVVKGEVAKPSKRSEDPLQRFGVP